MMDLIDFRRLVLNLIFFFLGVLIPLLAFQSAFAEVPCDFTSYADGSAELAAIVESSTATYYGSPVSYAYSCSLIGTYVVSGSNQVTSYYSTTQAGYDFCSSNPNSTLSSSYSRKRTITFSDGCILPPPEEPEHCFNTVQDEDETGINCGGSCSSTCVDLCPGGTEELVGLDGEPGCFSMSLTDDYGNCPSNTINAGSLGFPNACYGEFDYVPAAEGSDVGTVDSSSMEKGTLSVVEFESFENIVNNGDGTSTGVVTTTTTDSDGNTSTTTKTTDYTGENGTGSIAGTTTQTESDIPEEENPENYDYSLEEGEYDGEITSDDIPDKESITSLVQSFMSDNPVISTITGSGIDLDSSISQLTWVYPPTGSEIVFDFSDRGGVLSYMGFLLVFLSGISAYYIIVGRQ